MKFVGTLCWVLGTLLSAGDGATFQEQAARLQNINAYLLDFRPNAAPDRAPHGMFEVTLDVVPQPSVNTRVGNKEEPVDPPSVAPRLRARYHSAMGLTLGAAYSPGVTVKGYDAEYVSLELGYRFTLWDWYFAVRGSYSDGNIQGPITEPGAKDDFDFTNYGGDLSIGKRWNQFVFYGFVGTNEIETSLLIEIDGAFLRNEDEALYGGLGAAYDWGKLRLNFEQNFTDDYLKHITLSLSYRF